jgi:excinuclease ABC subunit C
MQDLLKSLPKIKISPKIYSAFPESAGVYVFFKDNYPIYIGKAINLKRRVSSYFNLDLEGKTASMVSDAQGLSYIQVGSELEALLLESKLIRSYMPIYNIAAKDDKHPLYIQITKEKYPRVITARKIAGRENNIAFYGPFPSSKNVRSVLRMLRRIFPYSDHKLGKRGCLYSHIGLCDPCPNIIETTSDKLQKTNLQDQYLKNIKHIKSILNGNIAKVRSNLEREMEELSKNQDFEKAGLIRDQIQKLEYITRPQMPTEFYMQNPNLYEDIRKNEALQLAAVLKNFNLLVPKIERIECFDVAHLAGTSPTASMVTFIKGEPDKNFYRHFRIRQIKSQDDYASMKEVISRRKNHLKDWGKPDLIIVDGGKGQVSVFLKELEGENIPVVGLAKRFETLVIPVSIYGTTILKEYRFPKGAALNLVERIRDEAHRFARTYHHKLVSRNMIQK